MRALKSLKFLKTTGAVAQQRVTPLSTYQFALVGIQIKYIKLGHEVRSFEAWKMWKCFINSRNSEVKRKPASIILHVTWCTLVITFWNRTDKIRMSKVDEKLVIDTVTPDVVSDSQESTVHAKQKFSLWPRTDLWALTVAFQQKQITSSDGLSLFYWRHPRSTFGSQFGTGNRRSKVMVTASSSYPTVINRSNIKYRDA